MASNPNPKPSSSKIQARKSEPPSICATQGPSSTSATPLWASATHPTQGASWLDEPNPTPLRANPRIGELGPIATTTGPSQAREGEAHARAAASSSGVSSGSNGSVKSGEMQGRGGKFQGAAREILQGSGSPAMLLAANFKKAGSPPTRTQREGSGKLFSDSDDVLDSGEESILLFLWHAIVLGNKHQRHVYLDRSGGSALVQADAKIKYKERLSQFGAKIVAKETFMQL